MVSRNEELLSNMDELETLEETLARELQEELSLPVSVGKLLICAQVINPSKKQGTLHCLFEGKILETAKPQINPTQTSALEVVWLEVNRLEGLNLYPSVGMSLKSVLDSVLTTPVYLGQITQPWF